MPTSAPPDPSPDSEPTQSAPPADSANPANESPAPARSPKPAKLTPAGARPVPPRPAATAGAPAPARPTPSKIGSRPAPVGARPAAAGTRPAGAAGTRTPLPPRKPPAKAWWTKQFYLWHWVSSAICLASMLVFSFTGVTLNHADQIPAEPQITERTATIPTEILASIAPDDGEEDEVKKPLPAPLRHWLDKELGIYVGGRAFEWSPEEIYVDLPRPGGDGWMSIDRESGEIVHEVTRRGWISYLNDLHKGRHTGTAWSWYMDIFAIACVIFTLTGLCLLYIHAKRRPTTWPVVIGGIVLPIIILIFFAHL